MAKFAKIIDIDENTQVLIFIDCKSETENNIVLLTDIEGLQAKLTFEFDNLEQANEGLNDFTKAKANDLVNQLKSGLIGD